MAGRKQKQIPGIDVVVEQREDGRWYSEAQESGSGVVAYRGFPQGYSTQKLARDAVLRWSRKTYMVDANEIETGQEPKHIAKFRSEADRFDRLAIEARAKAEEVRRGIGELDAMADGYEAAAATIRQTIEALTKPDQEVSDV